ncbi:right-handed parallel beta-helix repeat-containing protein [Arthrobacter rhizosphaerae]|uniref:right-handed parallel beta-helix repeat-containing protein n=1 Tax=Arthrobacter rhizosphaerae TaxID=2855490 RepID=UPI001FF41101|nr:right-handed parallel beta-helix repeat-containing protein [Arthrobacter rhizosphaerae]
MAAQSAAAAPGDKNPPVSYVPLAEKGAASGVATLDVESKIPPAQLPDLSRTYATVDSQGRQPVRKGELFLNVKDYGAAGDGVTDDTIAFQLVANIGGIAYLPAGIYIIASVSVTKNLSVVCQPGVTLKRAIGSDGAGTSYWAAGAAMFEVDAAGVTLQFSEFTYDGNSAKQTTTEPSGFFLKTSPPAVISGAPTTVRVNKGRFINGTSGYILLRGDDYRRRYETLTYLNDCHFSDTIYGKGKGDPSTPNALGYAPTYVMVMDYVKMRTKNFQAEFLKPTGTGQYAACAIKGTFYGQSHSMSGESSVFMHGTTEIRGLGRSGKRFDDDNEFKTNNGIGCIDMYGNAESLYIENVVAVDCKNVVIRAKGSLKNYTVLNAALTNCHRGLQVSPSSTGACETVVKVGNVNACGGAMPQLEFVGSSATDRLRSVTINSAHLLGTFTNPEGLGLQGVVHFRNITSLSVEGVTVIGAPSIGISVINVTTTNVSGRVDGVAGTGVGIYYDGGDFHNLNNFVINNTVGAGLYFATNPKKVTARDGCITNSTNYGIYLNTTTTEALVSGVDVDNVTGSSCGFYIGGGTSSFLNNKATNVRAPLSTANGARVRTVGNSWNGIQTTGRTAPTAGAWSVGDIVYNLAPLAGGTVGWICTTSGTPGVWKTFGAIAV